MLLNFENLRKNAPLLQFLSEKGTKLGELIHLDFSLGRAVVYSLTKGGYVNFEIKEANEKEKELKLSLPLEKFLKIIETYPIIKYDVETSNFIGNNDQVIINFGVENSNFEYEKFYDILKSQKENLMNLTPELMTFFRKSSIIINKSDNRFVDFIGVVVDNNYILATDKVRGFYGMIDKPIKKTLIDSNVVRAILLLKDYLDIEISCYREDDNASKFFLNFEQGEIVINNRTLTPMSLTKESFDRFYEGKRFEITYDVLEKLVNFYEGITLPEVNNRVFCEVKGNELYVECKDGGIYKNIYPIVPLDGDIELFCISINFFRLILSSFDSQDNRVVYIGSAALGELKIPMEKSIGKSIIHSKLRIK